jgi:hypothetical protein
MKRLVLTLTLASLAAFPNAGPNAGAAAPRARQCPSLSVSCPELVIEGLPVTYTVNVSGGPDDAKLTFNWVVSAGVINSGQSTTSITVDTVGVPQGSALTATVEVGGLPESCADSASCASALPPGCPRGKVDEYGDLRWSDERARLDNFAIEVRNWPESVGYLLGYGGRRSQRGEALRRLERAKRYLVTAGGVPAERVLIVDGGHREDLTVELWVSPKDAWPPQAAPTVDPGEVIYIKPAAKRRARRR